MQTPQFTSGSVVVHDSNNNNFIFRLTNLLYSSYLGQMNFWNEVDKTRPELREWLVWVAEQCWSSCWYDLWWPQNVTITSLTLVLATARSFTSSRSTFWISLFSLHIHLNLQTLYKFSVNYYIYCRSLQSNLYFLNETVEINWPAIYIKTYTG